MNNLSMNNQELSNFLKLREAQQHHQQSGILPGVSMSFDGTGERENSNNSNGNNQPTHTAFQHTQQHILGENSASFGHQVMGMGSLLNNNNNDSNVGGNPSNMTSSANNPGNANMIRHLQQLHQQQAQLPLPPQHQKNHNKREYMGGAAAAAYNAMKHDYYVKQRNQQLQHTDQVLVRNITDTSNTDSVEIPKSNGNNNTNRNTGTGSRADTPQAVSSSTTLSGGDPREHYELLKLHRINLLEEIQETSLMLNLYEQQRLRQQEEEIARMKQKEKQYLLHKLLNTSIVSNNSSSATVNSPHFRQNQPQDSHRSNNGNGSNNFHNLDNRAMNPIGLVVSGPDVPSNIQQQTRVPSSNEKGSVPLQTSSQDTLQIVRKETGPCGDEDVASFASEENDEDTGHDENVNVHDRPRDSSKSIHKDKNINDARVVSVSSTPLRTLSEIQKKRSFDETNCTNEQKINESPVNHDEDDTADEDDGDDDDNDLECGEGRFHGEECASLDYDTYPAGEDHLQKRAKSTSTTPSEPTK